MYNTPRIKATHENFGTFFCVFCSYILSSNNNHTLRHNPIFTWQISHRSKAKNFRKLGDWYTGALCRILRDTLCARCFSERWNSWTCWRITFTKKMASGGDRNSYGRWPWSAESLESKFLTKNPIYNSWRRVPSHPRKYGKSHVRDTKNLGSNDRKGRRI